MGKPVNAIYMEATDTSGSPEEQFASVKQVESDKKPTRVKWDAPLIQQNMAVLQEGKPGWIYQIPANGEDGFPLQINKPNESHGNLLNAGESYRLLATYSGVLSGEFTIPKQGGGKK